MASSEAAERHRRAAAAFGALVSGTTDWSARSPVPEWAARDVVGHLVGWLPALVEGGSAYAWPSSPDVDDDPVAAWRAHAEHVQQVLDDPDLAASAFAHQYVPATTLGEAIDRLYTSDVLMHAWDLARATGQSDPATPDVEAEAAAMLAGMREIEDVLRSSGQYGPAVPAPAHATALERLMAFVGRDPAFGRG